MAGGRGQGGALTQLHQPFGLDIDADGTLFIADTENHRLVRWRPHATQGEIVAGGKGQGDRSDQLNEPDAVLIDHVNDCLIVNEDENRRVMRWPLDPAKQNDGDGKVIISNIVSSGLAMGDDGSLYVSDWEKHEVRRYGQEAGPQGVVVAGGNGTGAALDQVKRPRDIFVDADHSVYVSDSLNNRVMKWSRDAKQGLLIAGGRGKGKSLGELNFPSGIIVDRMGSVYVADQLNHRVVRWVKGAKEGEVVAGGNGEGSNANQLNQPGSISFDAEGNLYVVDCNNHRIQRFDLQSDL